MGNLAGDRLLRRLECAQRIFDEAAVAYVRKKSLLDFSAALALNML
jgi:hypothetical protein